MKHRGNFYLLAVLVLFTGFFSCSKEEEDFNAQGGLLPSNYITIKDSSFSPNVITVANGSSFTFLNRSGSTRTLVSADSSTILSPIINDGLSFYVKPDTSAGTQSVVIYYHCKERPAVTGTIILRP